jgi:hypothetical protein
MHAMMRALVVVLVVLVVAAGCGAPTHARLPLCVRTAGDARDLVVSVGNGAPVPLKSGGVLAGFLEGAPAGKPFPVAAGESAAALGAWMAVGEAPALDAGSKGEAVKPLEVALQRGSSDAPKTLVLVKPRRDDVTRPISSALTVFLNGRNIGTTDRHGNLAALVPKNLVPQHPLLRGTAPPGSVPDKHTLELATFLKDVNGERIVVGVYRFEEVQEDDEDDDGDKAKQEAPK